MEQCMRQGLVVGEEGELTALHEESEVTNGGISCQKLCRRRSTWIWWKKVSWRKRQVETRNHRDILRVRRINDQGDKRRVKGE